jgi:hypothetical protein
VRIAERPALVGERAAAEREGQKLALMVLEPLAVDAREVRLQLGVRP